MTVHKGAFSADPKTCLASANRALGNRLCALCGVWVNCPSAGCFVRPDGSYIEPDNSPEARAKRLREIGRKK